MMILQEHIVHAIVVVIVVIAATILRYSGHIDNNTVSIVYGAAVGYAAGRSGTGRPSRVKETAQ